MISALAAIEGSAGVGTSGSGKLHLPVPDTAYKQVLITAAGVLPCGEAGYSGCCSEGSCFVEAGDCYCDQSCHSVANCCPDIFEIGCFCKSVIIDIV